MDWSRVTLVKGWFDDTATPATAAAHGITSAGVVMVDCDNYSSAKAALRFAAPLLGRRAVVVFDDWHHAGLAERGLGEKRAFEEFLAEHPEFRAEPFGSYAPKAEVFALTRSA